MFPFTYRGLLLMTLVLFCYACELERSPHLLSGECSITVEVEPPASLTSGKAPPQPCAPRN